MGSQFSQFKYFSLLPVSPGLLRQGKWQKANYKEKDKARIDIGQRITKGSMRAWWGLPIVSGDHIGGHHEWGSSGASQPKVEDLESAVGPHHYVARLQVSDQSEHIWYSTYWRRRRRSTCGWCRRGGGAWCHRASGRGGKTSAHGPSPCWSPVVLHFVSVCAGKSKSLDLAQVCIHKFHHNVEIEKLLKGLLGGEAVEQADDVLVVD